jgi:hypothetical protein
VAHHVGPPLYCLTTRPGQGSVAETERFGRLVTAFGERLVFGRNRRRDAGWPPADAPSSIAGLRWEPTRRDARDSRLARREQASPAAL